MSRPSDEGVVRDQLGAATANATGTSDRQLASLLAAGDTWTVN